MDMGNRLVVAKRRGREWDAQGKKKKKDKLKCFEISLLPKLQ